MSSGWKRSFGGFKEGQSLVQPRDMQISVSYRRRSSLIDISNHCCLGVAACTRSFSIIIIAIPSPMLAFSTKHVGIYAPGPTVACKKPKCFLFSTGRALVSRLNHQHHVWMSIAIRVVDNLSHDIQGRNISQKSAIPDCQLKGSMACAAFQSITIV